MVETRRREASFAQTNMNIAGAGITALLAVTPGQHSRSIFNVASLLTASNAVFENYKAQYVLTPDVQVVHDQVKRLRDQKAGGMLTKAHAPGGYKSYGEAKQELLNYENLCSAANIRKIVTESVQVAKFVFDDGTPELRGLKADTALRELHKLVKGKDGKVDMDPFRMLLLAVRNRHEPGLVKPMTEGDAETDLKISGGKELIVSAGYNATESPPNFGFKPDVINKVEEINALLDVANDPKTVKIQAYLQVEFDEARKAKEVADKKAKDDAEKKAKDETQKIVDAKDRQIAALQLKLKQQQEQAEAAKKKDGQAEPVQPSPAPAAQPQAQPRAPQARPAPVAPPAAAPQPRASKKLADEIQRMSPSQAGTSGASSRESWVFRAVRPADK